MTLEIQIKDNKIYTPLKEKWLVVKPEERVRQEYICRLVNNYFWRSYRKIIANNRSR